MAIKLAALAARESTTTSTRPAWFLRRLKIARPSLATPPGLLIDTVTGPPRRSAARTSGAVFGASPMTPSMAMWIMLVPPQLVGGRGERVDKAGDERLDEEHDEGRRHVRAQGELLDRDVPAGARLGGHLGEDLAGGRVSLDRGLDLGEAEHVAVLGLAAQPAVGGAVERSGFVGHELVLLGGGEGAHVVARVDLCQSLALRLKAGRGCALQRDGEAVRRPRAAAGSSQARAGVRQVEGDASAAATAGPCPAAR